MAWFIFTILFVPVWLKVATNELEAMTADDAMNAAMDNGSDMPSSRQSLADHFADSADRRRHGSASHTRLVNLLKLFLVALAAGLILTVIAWSTGDNDGEGIPFTFKSISGVGSDQQTMVDPKYVGSDKNGRPFVVTADTAMQHKDNQRIVSLANLRADISVDVDHQVKATARQGLFNQDQLTLELFGPVAIRSSKGYQLYTAGAFVNLSEGTAYSTEPVEGEGPLGTITANRMRVGEKGASIFFSGRVHLVINNDRTRQNE